MKLISTTEMKELEKAADAAGFSYSAMMEKAGKGIASVIGQRFNQIKQIRIIGLVGGGNNGGDTLIALKELQQKGWSTSALLVMERSSSDPLILNYLASGGSILDVDQALNLDGEQEFLFLDGVFGTGFHPPLPDNVQFLFTQLKQQFPGAQWIAIDCPSGVDCEKGIVSPGTLAASLTICLEAVKKGMLTYTSFPYCGELISVELGISQYGSYSYSEGSFVADPDMIREILPQRSDFAHKGSFGKVLVIGGSSNYPGAPVLAGRGAYSVGVGLVQVAIPESIAQISAADTPELTWLILPDAGGIISEMATETILPVCQTIQSMVIGPGMAREETTRRFLENLLRGKKERKTKAGFPGVSAINLDDENGQIHFPLVIDADGLYLISRQDHWWQVLPAETVLTPHPGEMALMSGLSITDIQEDRLGVSKEFAAKWQVTLVLKGALTVVAEPDGRLAVIPVASSSLAKAGSGDVLAGIIGGLLAQRVPAWEAALAGAWLHAQAGKVSALHAGCAESVLASDLIRAVPKVIASVKSNDLH